MGKHVELPVMWNITGPSIQCCRCNWEINQGLKFFHNLALVHNLYVIHVEIAYSQKAKVICPTGEYQCETGVANFVTQELQMNHCIWRIWGPHETHLDMFCMFHNLGVRDDRNTHWLITSFMSIYEKLWTWKHIRMTVKTTQLKPRDNHEYVLFPTSLPQFSAIPRSLFDSPEDHPPSAIFDENNRGRLTTLPVWNLPWRFIVESMIKISVSPNFRSAGPKWFGRIELKIEAWKSVWKLRSLWLPYLPSWQVVNLFQGHTLWQVSLPSWIGKTNGWNLNMLTWTQEEELRNLNIIRFGRTQGKLFRWLSPGNLPKKKHTKPSTAKVINFDLP